MLPIITRKLAPLRTVGKIVFFATVNATLVVGSVVVYAGYTLIKLYLPGASTLHAVTLQQRQVAPAPAKSARRQRELGARPINTSAPELPLDGTLAPPSSPTEQVSLAESQATPAATIAPDANSERTLINTADSSTRSSRSSTLSALLKPLLKPKKKPQCHASPQHPASSLNAFRCVDCHRAKALRQHENIERVADPMTIVTRQISDTSGESTSSGIWVHPKSTWSPRKMTPDLFHEINANRAFARAEAMDREWREEEEKRRRWREKKAKVLSSVHPSKLGRKLKKMVKGVAGGKKDQLRDLLVAPPEAAGTCSTISNEWIARHSLSNTRTTSFTRLPFLATTLVSGCGLIAAGGQLSELALRSATPSSSWLSTTQAQAGLNINNSLFIAPSPVRAGVPRVLVSNNDMTVKVYEVSGKVPDYEAGHTRRHAQRKRNSFVGSSSSAMRAPTPPEVGQDEETMEEDEEATLFGGEEQDEWREGEEVPVMEELQHARIKLHTPVNHSSVSPDGRRLICVGDTNEAFLFDVLHNGSYELVHTFQTSTDASFSTDWARSSDKFAIASQDGFVHVYDVRNLPSSSGAAAGASSGTPPPRRLATIPTSQSGPAGAARKVAFSPRGLGSELMAFTEHRAKVHVVDARTFSDVQVLEVTNPQSQRGWNDEGPALAPTREGSPVGLRRNRGEEGGFRSAFATATASSRVAGGRWQMPPVPVARSTTAAAARAEEAAHERERRADTERYLIARAARERERERRSPFALDRDGNPATLSTGERSELRRRMDLGREQRMRRNANANGEMVAEEDTETETDEIITDEDDDEDLDELDMLGTRDRERERARGGMNGSMPGLLRVPQAQTSREQRQSLGESVISDAVASRSRSRLAGVPPAPWRVDAPSTSSASTRFPTFGPGSMLNNASLSSSAAAANYYSPSSGASAHWTGYHSTSSFFPVEADVRDVLGLAWDEWGEGLMVATGEAVWSFTVDGKARRSRGEWGLL